MSARRITKLFTLALPAAALVAVAVWMFDLTGAREPNLSYDTVEAANGTIRRIVSTSGPVRALVTVSVGSQLSGQVDIVNVDFNSEVKPGDILARLDARTYAARAAQAEADLKAAEAALSNQEASKIKAEAVLRNTEQVIARQKSLAAKGFAAQSALDTATRDQAVAAADIAVAKAQIESAKATIAQRKASLDQARIDLDRSDIRSPINGTVISRTVDPGQTVAASLQAPELFKIAQDLSRIRIEAQVNEADVGTVAEGNPVVFTVDAYPDREFEGRVTQVRLAATEINNVVTYTVIIEAVNEDRRLFPGMTANVRVESARRDGVLRVPNDVFRFRPRGAAGELTGRREGGEAGQRGARIIERLKTEIELTDEQEKAVREAFAALQAENQQRSGPALGAPRFDQAAFRQQLIARIDQVLGPTLSDQQRKQYDRWKLGREGTRVAAVWVLDTSGKPERRTVRAGLADDQFTEILGGQLAEGDRVIVRAREAAK